MSFTFLIYNNKIPTDQNITDVRLTKLKAGATTVIAGFEIKSKENLGECPLLYLFCNPSSLPSMTTP